MNNEITLYVISHTHWDREWYESFQNYRFRLVRMMDDLLDVMENDPEYRYFHLDGQTIVLEDYLEIRPENAERIKKLIRDGRILIGPWYVMPDEFLVSGESLVRNLQKGTAITREYGTSYMKNGYVTDIFGHNAQLPQIMRGFGIDSATLFRGIGDYKKDAFEWEGADGSKITVLKLDPDRCYSNFYFSLRWPFEGKETDYDDLLKRAKEMIERSRQAAVSDVYLMMDGVDHIGAEPRLPEILAFLNEKLEGIRVKHATLEDYLEALKNADPQLETMRGPLYSVGSKGLNNRVLKNVLSSMVHLKQQNDACETLLTGWAEPFDFAAAYGIHAYRQDANIRHAEPRNGFIGTAWKYLLQNHPHDSIGGCSITDVHKDNEFRFRQSMQIAERITQDALECIAENIDASALDADLCYAVFNPSQTDVDGYTAVSFDLPVNAYGNFKLVDADGAEIPYQLMDIADTAFKRNAPIRKLIRFDAYETCTVAADMKIPAHGYALAGVKILRDAGPFDGEYKAEVEQDRTRYPGTMRISRRKWDNGRLIVEIAENGTLNVTNKETGRVYENVLLFEDCADIGDGWNYVKPAVDAEYLTACGGADAAVRSDGPFALVLEITQRLMLPDPNFISSKRRTDDRELFEITTTVTLLKNSNTLDFKTNLNNTIRNHRLRVIFPTGFDAESFYTQTPFDMQKWSVKKADFSKCKETDTLVNPTQGVTFVSDDHNTVEVYGKGLYEVEVSETDRAVALTLFRAFPNEVGQAMADRGQMQSPMSFAYAARFDAGRDPALALKDSIRWKMGLKTCKTDKHDGELPARFSFVKVDGNTSIVSSLCHDHALPCGRNEDLIRLYNPSDTEDTVTVTFCKPIAEAYIADFIGNMQEPVRVDGHSVSLNIGPHGIKTVIFKAIPHNSDGAIAPSDFSSV